MATLTLRGLTSANSSLDGVGFILQCLARFLRMVCFCNLARSNQFGLHRQGGSLNFFGLLLYGSSLFAIGILI